MPSPSAPARLTIDLDALAANYRLLCDEAAGAEVAPVVKADGYGLGAAPIAERLWAEGARRFFTARLRGGELLRASLGEDRPARIYVLDGCLDGWGPRLEAADLTPVLSSPGQIETWKAHADGRALPAALQIDTGMSRLGVTPAEAQALAEQGVLAGLSLDLVMSHLACAGEPAHPLNALQAQRFTQARTLFPQARASLANSEASFLGPDYRFDLVRPGIALYGGGAAYRPGVRLNPVASFEAQIIQVRTIQPGDSVGYGATFTATAPTQVAIIGVGYADGVVRSPDGGVWFEGAERRFLGRLSMDLAAIDVTGCEAARPGAWVELFGANLTLDRAAATAGVLGYELLTRIAPRVERVYRG
jgi:alanine racemase